MIPDKTRNNKVFPLITVIPDIVLVKRTRIHEKTKTAMVRMAVATSEFVFEIPHFSSMEVIPAKKAEPVAYKIHIVSPK